MVVVFVVSGMVVLCLVGYEMIGIVKVVSNL